MTLDGMLSLRDGIALSKGAVSYQLLRDAVLRGDVVSQKVGCMWFVSKPSLLAWLKKREERRAELARRNLIIANNGHAAV
jgi:hypothetical protein